MKRLLIIIDVEENWVEPEAVNTAAALLTADGEYPIAGELIDARWLIEIIPSLIK